MLTEFSGPELAKLTDHLRASGLDASEIETAADEAAKRAASINRGVAEIRTRAEAATTAIGSRLADGDLSVAEAVAEHERATGAIQEMGARGGGLRRIELLRRAALKEVQMRVTRLIANRAGDILVMFEEAFEAIDTERAKLSETLEGVTSADAAMLKGGQVAKAWSQRVALDERRHHLLKARQILGSHGVFDQPKPKSKAPPPKKGSRWVKARVGEPGFVSRDPMKGRTEVIEEERIVG